jgi:hypothetical protein
MPGTMPPVASSHPAFAAMMLAACEAIVHFSIPR